MADLSDVLIYLFPDITFSQHPNDSADCLLIGDEFGNATIANWNRPEPQPSAEALAAAANSAEFIFWQLNRAKNAAIATVYQQAEAARARYITNLPGKVGEYTLKKAEYDLWVERGQPSEPDHQLYPIAHAESAAWGITLTEMLQVWGERITEWAVVSGRIAAAERAAIIAINSAEFESDIQTVLNGLVWP